MTKIKAGPREDDDYGGERIRPMPKTFIVHPLSPRRIDQALPIVQALHGDLTVEQWRGVAAPFLAPTRDVGILACVSGSGHIRGLFCHQLTRERSMRILAVPIFAVVGLFDAGATAEALIESLERLADHMECGAVEIAQEGCVVSSSVPSIDATLLLARFGYRPRGEILSKLLGDDLAEPAFPVAGMA